MHQAVAMVLLLRKRIARKCSGSAARQQSGDGFALVDRRIRRLSRGGLRLPGGRGRLAVRGRTPGSPPGGAGAPGRRWRPPQRPACTRRRQPSAAEWSATSGSAGAVSLVIGAGRLPRSALGTDVIGFRVGPRLMPASSASSGSPQGRGVGCRPRVADPPAPPAP
jgi:hypothetical protein